MPRRRPGEFEALGHSEAAAPADPSVRRGPALVVGVVAGIVVTVAVLLAVVQNDDDVRLEWASFDLDAPLWLLLLTAAAVGALVSAVGRWLAHRTSRPRHGLHAVRARHEAPAPRPVRTLP